MDIPFFPGRKPQRPDPLAVFLPPHHDGVGREFLRRFDGPAIRVADPFGQSPALTLELARAGAAVLVASPNPVVRALLRLQAEPPPSSTLRGVFRRMASAPMAGGRSAETIEQHIRGLYRTYCSACGSEIEATGFIWSREGPEDPDGDSAPDTQAPGSAERTGRGRERDAPYRLIKREYRCPHCNHAGEEAALETDRELAHPYLARTGYYHKALEKIAAPDDPDRAHAVEALNVYPPRSIYALFAILARFEAMQLGQTDRWCADLLMLTALDAAHMLRGHAASTRLRPRSLLRPAEYREANVWGLLEQSVEEWSIPSTPVPVCKWQPGDPLREGEAAVYAGTARDLAAHLPGVRPDAIITHLPRPNQAAWTLSAMWAGWLWGRHAAAALGPVLRRRRYDWNWHARALAASATALAAHLPGGAPTAGLIGESEPGFLAASLWAFHQAGFELQGAALRADTDTAQIIWHAPSPSKPRLTLAPRSCEPVEDVARLAARRLISWRAEPTQWELLHASAWCEAAFRHMLPAAPENEEEAGFSACQSAIHAAITEDPELASARREESDLGQTWWMPSAERTANPLSDQVETETARILLEHGPLESEELDGRVCAQFPGLLTPESRLVRACLHSYGVVSPERPLWISREEDLPEAREAEREEVRRQLSRLARKLGFRAAGGQPLEWRDADGRLVYSFCLMTSAAIGRFLLDPDLAPECAWIVLPGGRASLVEYKLRRNVRLRRAVERGWRFLKYRHVRRLSEDSLLQAGNLDSRLNMDPLGTERDQIAFL